MNKRIVVTMDIFDDITQKDLLSKVSSIQQSVVGLFDKVNIAIMAGETNVRGEVDNVPPGAECDCPVCTARREADGGAPIQDGIDADSVARRASYLTIMESEPELIKAIKKFRDDAIGFDRLMELIAQAVPASSPGSLPGEDVAFTQQMVRLAAEYIFLDEDGG